MSILDSIKSGFEWLGGEKDSIPPTTFTPRTKTKAQLVSEMNAKKSKRDLLIELNGGSPIITTDPDILYREDGQMEFQASWDKDVETDKLVGGTQVIWTYYPTGEVDEIAILEIDENEEVVHQKVIKHFLKPGMNPVVTEEEE